MRAGILDYGAGNLFSLARAVRAGGADAVITSDTALALSCDVLLLPGVGAFGSATRFLDPHRDDIATALKQGMPCLGICLGMQLLFEESEEGPGRGLGVIAGSVRRISAKRVPQMGWNTLEDVTEPLLSGSNLDVAYFANSYVCRPTDLETVSSWTTHEADRFPASVRRGSIVGMQFHPEKSSSAGLSAIAAFLKEAGR